MAFVAATADEAWLAAFVRWGDERTEVWRKRGGQWSAEPELARPIGLAPAPDGRLLAVAANLALWRREEGRWRQIVPGREGFEGRGVAAIPHDVDDAWALALGGLLRWDGAAWSNLAEPVGLGFLDLRAAPDGSAFAVGMGASVVRRSP